MPKIDIEQGTQEWLSMRRKHVTGTDAAVLMGVGWTTPYELWVQKLSGAEIPVNEHMERGRRLEPEARYWLEKHWGVSLPAECHKHPQFEGIMASLDGLSPAGLLVEIKCPTHKNHCWNLENGVPMHYKPQLQHQMEVVGVKEMFFVSYCPDYSDAPHFVKVRRDELYAKEMIEKELQFYEFIKNLIPPDLTDKDCGHIEFDMDFERLVEAFRACKENLTYWENEDERLRKDLYAYAKERNVKGYGIKISKSFRKGNVDYSIIPELKGVDLERYRKEPSQIFRINID